jgi:carbonic anhydrase/acetyltransferase-like protein (isoleucine patch superfamily)
VVGANALVGNGSTVLDGSRIGIGSMIAAGGLVTPGTELPDGVLAAGAPAKVRGPIEGTAAQAWVEGNPAYYQELARRHRDGIAGTDAEA